MHGRVKVKTTAEQQETKNKERAKKLELYMTGFQKTHQKRQNGEMDDEALAVTGQLLIANPDVSTLWNFRREVLLKMHTDKSESDFTALMDEELSFVEYCLRTNPKSYNGWHQRQWIIQQMTEPNWSQELQLCNKYLELDDRNFHCWDYRRFIVQNSFVDGIEELKFTYAKVASNFSNYSSWHYRSKLLPSIYPDNETGGLLQEEKLLEEFDLIQNAVFTDPNDQSAWFYHRWLLGRGEQHLAITLFYVNLIKKKCAVVFNKPLQVKNESNFHLTINGNNCSSTWNVPLFCRQIGFSSIWVGEVCDEVPKEEDIFVCLQYTDVDCSLEQSLIIRKGDIACVWRNCDVKNIFRSALSAATKSVLLQELESCNQLHELEPENKWTLFTSILLMRNLDLGQHSSDILLAFNKLEEVDPLRKGHYRDLRSKFVVETFLEKLENSTTEIDLSNRHLTALYHAEYFCHMTKVNLSSNHLRSMKCSNILHFVIELDVSKNEIEQCSGLEEMPYLSILNLSYNKIHELEALEPLKSCLSLKSVLLTGNLVVDKNTFNAFMVEMLAGVQF